MSDTRISAYDPLSQAGIQASVDLLPIVDLSASETKKITVKELFQGAAQQADPGSVPIAVLDTSTGIPGHDVNFTQADVLLGRDGSGAGQGLEIPCTQTGRDVLAAADAAGVRTALGLGDLALAIGTWADGSSFSGDSSGTNTGDQTIVLTGAVFGAGTGTFTTAYTNGSVNEAALADGAVTTPKLAAKAVAASKLGDNSSVVVSTGAPSGAGAFSGQLQVNASDDALYYYDAGVGSWSQVAGFTSLTVADATPMSWAVSFPAGPNAPQLDVTLEAQAPNAVWAGPASGAANGTPAFRALVGADLPVPTGAARGGVHQGEGTLISDTGELTLAPATHTTIGGVKAGGGLDARADGLVSHIVSALPAGTYTKVTTDSLGHVVGNAPLDAADIPDLPATKIRGGTFDPTLFAAQSITRAALANYAIAYIQEENPGIVTDHNGCLWLQESSGQLRMWNGNSWFPVGFGRLAQENLRWGGTVNATTNQVAIVTELGAAAGLTVGNALPPASDSLSGIYVVVDTGGSAIAVTPGTAYDPGDWVLCVSQAQGWVRIDTLTGGGGGGSSTLSGLNDTNIAAPAAGQTLLYNATLGTWENKPLPAAVVGSVFGRTGAITAAEGDYTLNLLGDVDLATVAPADGNLLRFNAAAGQWQVSTVASLSVTTTAGDLIVRGASADQRVPIGAANTQLHVNATGDGVTWRAATAATEAVAGVAAIATQLEVDTGTNNTKILTPQKLANATIRCGTY